jgi:arsenate reductase
LTQIWTQIAAAHYGVNHVQTFSGGTEVTACNPRTVAALKRCGLRFSVLKEDGSNPHYSVAFSDRNRRWSAFQKSSIARRIRRRTTAL